MIGVGIKVDRTNLCPVTAYWGFLYILSVHEDDDDMKRKDEIVIIALAKGTPTVHSDFYSRDGLC